MDLFIRQFWNDKQKKKITWRNIIAPPVKGIELYWIKAKLLSSNGFHIKWIMGKFWSIPTMIKLPWSDVVGCMRVKKHYTIDFYSHQPTPSM